MRRTKKTDYLILALLCLILLNIGSMIIRTRSDIELPNMVNSAQMEITTTFFQYMKEKWDGVAPLKKTLDAFKKQENIINENYPEVLEPDKESEENINHQDKNVEDIIIEKLDEYESLIIIRDSQGFHGVGNIPEPIGIEKFKIERDKPYIFMYHTHATEAYAENKIDNYRSSKKEENVLGIGEVIGKVLEAKGHRVDHNMTYHDLPSYNKSYSRSLNTIQGKKAESENLKVFFDVHRDAVADESNNIANLKKKSEVEINGKRYAKFSLVVGPDSENKEYTLAFAKYIKAVSDTIYPGLCSGIIIKPRGRYNQHLSNYSTLIEMGYNFHDKEMVVESAKLVAEVLSYAIDGLIQQ